MRILVTGGSGFIGSNLVRHLLTETTHEVLNLDKLTYAGYPASLADLVEHPSYAFRQACLCDRATVDAAFSDFQPEAVIHLAAESHVDRSIDGPAAFIETNTVGTYSLLEASRAYLKHDSDRAEHFRFLHVSTDEVYGSLGPDDPPFNERTPYAPRSPYAASKAASDHLARAWHTTYGLPVLVTNCSNNYGPYQFPEKLIPTVILKALNHDRIPVYGTGDNIRDWIFVEDHVRALLRVLEQGQPGDTFSIGAGAEVRNIDLVRTLCELLDELAPNPPSAGHASLITFVQDRPGHDHRYAIDASRITTELGWFPQHALSQGLRTTVEWYLHNPNWWQPLLTDGKNAIDRKGLSTEHASL